jgi:hypothetical protein
MKMRWMRIGAKRRQIGDRTWVSIGADDTQALPPARVGIGLNPLQGKFGK